MRFCETTGAEKKTNATVGRPVWAYPLLTGDDANHSPDIVIAAVHLHLGRSGCTRKPTRRRSGRSGIEERRVVTR
jgi:hypothetical protein